MGNVQKFLKIVLSYLLRGNITHFVRGNITHLCVSPCTVLKFVPK